MQRKESFEGVGILIVDMQPKCLNHVHRAELEKQVAAITAVLQLSIQKDFPVLVLEYTGYGKTIPKIKSLMSNVKRHTYLQKCWNDGFTNENVEPILSNWGVMNLCVMGVSAAYCVKKTSSSAINNGFSLLTARQLLSSQTHREEEFKNCLPWFKAHTHYYDNHEDLLHVLSFST